MLKKSSALLALIFVLTSAFSFCVFAEPENEAEEPAAVTEAEEMAEETESECFFENMTIEEHVEFYEKQGLRKMDAIKACAKDRGVAKNEVYKHFV